MAVDEQIIDSLTYRILRIQPAGGVPAERSCSHMVMTSYIMKALATKHSDLSGCVL
jgi:hypothetical protein